MGPPAKREQVGPSGQLRQRDSSTVRRCTWICLGWCVSRFLAESALCPHCPLSWIRREVGVDLRRLVVAVAHPALERPQRRASRGHSCSIGVPEVMEAKRAQAGPRERLLEPNPTLARVVRLARVRMADDEIVVVNVRGALEVTLEFAGNAIRHGYGATCAAALGRCVLATGVAAPDTDQAGAPVDITPAQRGKLALAKPRHGGGEPEHAIGRTEAGRRPRRAAAPRAPRGRGSGCRGRLAVTVADRSSRRRSSVTQPALEREREARRGRS